MAISPIDSGNVIFFDEPMGKKKSFVYIMTDLVTIHPDGLELTLLVLNLTFPRKRLGIEDG